MIMIIIIMSSSGCWSTVQPVSLKSNGQNVSTLKISRLLDSLLENYDNMLRPEFGGKF